ncbi:MAG: PAS domain S-box protein [Bacteroidota bacterium]|nr:PAS domain S-box protein [Bacteroidota bacterium]
MSSSSSTTLPERLLPDPDRPAQSRIRQLEQELAQARAREAAALEQVQQLAKLATPAGAASFRDAQRAFYEKILDELPVEVVVLDEQFRYIYANPQAVPDAGQRAWLLGHTVTEYCARYGFPLALAEQRRRMFDQALESPEPVVWDDCTPYPTGNSYHQRHFKLLAQVGAGTPFMLGYGLDVTARVEAEARSQRSEAAQREQQEFMQQVLDTNPSAIYVRDAQGQLVFSNRAMAQLAGEGQLHQQLLAPSSPLPRIGPPGIGDDLVLATGEEITSEDHLTLASGEARWFHSVRRPLRRPDGNVHVLGVSTDISDLKQAQYTLARSEKQYRDLMHYAQALICTYDLRGQLLSVNPALASLLGHSTETVAGRSMADFLLAEDRAGFPQFLARLDAAGEAQGVLRVLRARPNGEAEVRHLLYHTFVMREPGQEPYIISHAHDITGRIMAEHETQRAREEAEASARARQNFLANMSHEIRTPMNGVLGMTAQLAKTRLDPRQQELVRVIGSSGRHLLAVLNDVLDMAKISAGKLELEASPFNLCDSVGEALHPLMTQAREKGLAFHSKALRETYPNSWIVGDAHRLNQVLLNLVSNAIKFTTQGSISVTSQLLTETKTTMTVRFCVADTGPGIEPAQQALMFESFTQANADTARQHGGTGLGLSISRALVAQMGGLLQLESKPGEGSSFCFALTLPKAPAPAADTPAAAATYDTGRLRGARVLLIEDNEINRTVARMMLEPWGVELDEVEDGATGLARLAENDYDLVLTDIQMPGLSGIDVTQRLRQLPDPRRAATPIIALTANAFRADIERYLAAGVNDCLTKPYDEATLYQKMEALLPSLAPVFDLGPLRNMAQGRAAFVNKIIQSFLTNMPTSVAQLRAAGAAGNWAEVGRLVHHIKPNLHTLRVADISEPVELLVRLHHGEQSALAEPPAMLQQALAQLLAAVERALAVLPGEIEA